MRAFVTLCPILLAGLVLSTHAQDQNAAADEPKHYDAAKTLLLKEAKSDDDRARLQHMFRLIEEQTANLNGRSPWKNGIEQAGSFQELKRTLSSLQEEDRGALVVGLYRDGDRHDYVRQAALQSVLEHPAYKKVDLPSLCAVFLAIPTNSAVLHTSRRDWVEPETAKLRLAAIIESLVTPTSSSITDASTKAKSVEQPALWLTTMLEERLEVASGEEVTILAECLEMVTTTQPSSRPDVR